MDFKDIEIPNIEKMPFCIICFFCWVTGILLIGQIVYVIWKYFDCVSQYIDMVDSSLKLNNNGNENDAKSVCLKNPVVVVYTILICVYTVVTVSYLFVIIRIRIQLQQARLKNVTTTNRHAETELANVIDEEKVCLLHPFSNTSEYFMVLKLIYNTWQYADDMRRGHDSLNLVHNNVKVKLILKITNNDLWQKYVLKRDSLLLETTEETTTIEGVTTITIVVVNN